MAVWNTLFFVVMSLWSNRGKALDILFWNPSVGGDDPAGSKFAPTPFLCCLVETCEVEVRSVWSYACLSGQLIMALWIDPRGFTQGWQMVSLSPPRGSLDVQVHR